MVSLSGPQKILFKEYLGSFMRYANFGVIDISRGVEGGGPLVPSRFSP